MSGKERLQKLMAHAGLGSRRTCEEMIRQGRVMVNGRVAQLGQKADLEQDKIVVDGRPIRGRSRFTYIMLHKPPGIVSTARDTHGRPTVLDLVELSTRLYPVGRLDLHSEGLILLTDDGELTFRLTHPRYRVEKEYHVLVRGWPPQQVLHRWREGRVLKGERPAPVKVEFLEQEGGNAWLRIILHEGRKRQIRRTAHALEYPVLRLIRVRLDGLRLGDLPSGEWRKLRSQELSALRQSVGLGHAD